MKNILSLGLTFLISASLFGQIKELSRVLSKNKTVSDAMAGHPAISTCFADVNTRETLPPEFGEGKTYMLLDSLRPLTNGHFRLSPGFYEQTNLSYCLKAGTHGPSKGDVYGLAPVAGKMSDIVMAILFKSDLMWRTGKARIAGSALSQHDVQLLLWAIIAKADFESMSGRTKATAIALLTPDQLIKLNGGAIKSFTNLAEDKGWMRKPPLIRQIEESEQGLRRLYQGGTSNYEDFERLAVLAGMASEPQGVAYGTWFKHPNGYYVRYQPHGYPRTHTQIYVPESFIDGVDFYRTGFVATPTDSRQRLAQTDLPEGMARN